MLAPTEQFDASNFAGKSSKFEPYCSTISNVSSLKKSLWDESENFLDYYTSPDSSWKSSLTRHCDKKPCRDLDDLAANFRLLSFTLDKWNITSQTARSDDPHVRYEGTKNLRTLLSASGELPIQSIVETGIVPTLVRYLSFPDIELQFEAAWALTNIASGTKTQTEVVVSNGGIASFIQLLASNKEEIREQGMWGLANIAGDRESYRDMILETEGAVDLLIQAISCCSVVSTACTGIWAISNLCRGKPRPKINFVLPFVKLLVNVLDSYSDASILSDVCWSLDAISEHSLGMRNIVEYNAVPRLVALLSNESSSIRRPALRIIGQVTTGDSTQTQVVLDAGAPEVLVRLLESERQLIRKDACWILSNIAAGDNKQVQALFDCDAFPSLLKIYNGDEEPEVRKEAAWAVCNACTTGSVAQVSNLIHMNCVRLICEMLDTDDEEMLEVVLDSFLRIIKIGEDYVLKYEQAENPCIHLIAEADGFSKLHRLRHYPSFGINSKVSMIFSHVGADEKFCQM